MNLKDAKRIVLARAVDLLQKETDELPEWMFVDGHGAELTPTGVQRMQRAVDEVIAELHARSAR